MHEYMSRLEKIFLLSLVQNAKCQHITRPENLEFLGEFAGGAKITRTEKAKEKNGKDSYRSLQRRKKKKLQIVEDNGPLQMATAHFFFDLVSKLKLSKFSSFYCKIDTYMHAPPMKISKSKQKKK